MRFGAVPPAKAVTAYLWTPETEGAYRMAFRLLQEGYRLATSTEPLRAGGRDYPRGTLLARVERNPASLHERVTALAKECGVPSPRRTLLTWTQAASGRVRRKWFPCKCRRWR